MSDSLTSVLGYYQCLPSCGRNLDWWLVCRSPVPAHCSAPMHPTPPIINTRNWDEAYSSPDIFYIHQSNLYMLGPCHAFCPASLILLPALSDSFIKHKVGIESEHETVRISDMLLLQDSWEAGTEG